MSSKDIAFYLGETWTIEGVANKADGTPLDLTGATVEWRIASPTALIFKTQPGDVAIVSAAAGTYTINIPANDARQDGLVANTYDYEVDVQDGAGGVTTQNVGRITLKSSLRKRFP